MSVPNSKRMGQHNQRADCKAEGVNQAMGQGKTVRIPLARGLEAQMGQHKRILAGAGKWNKSANAMINGTGR